MEMSEKTIKHKDSWCPLKPLKDIVAENFPEMNLWIDYKAHITTDKKYVDAKPQLRK
jgi:hypothetical protein